MQHTLGQVTPPLPLHLLKSRGGEGRWQKERGLGNPEWGSWKRDSSPRAILHVRVGRERERRAKSPCWQPGANQRGCYSPPGDLFKGLRLQEPEQTSAAGVVLAVSQSLQQPLPAGSVPAGSEVSPLPRESPTAGKGTETGDRPLGKGVALGAGDGVRWTPLSRTWRQRVLGC